MPACQSASVSFKHFVFLSALLHLVQRLTPSLRRGCRIATCAWRARTPPKKASPRIASLLPGWDLGHWEDCVRGTFNQRRGCSSGLQSSGPVRSGGHCLDRSSPRKQSRFNLIQRRTRQALYSSFPSSLSSHGRGVASVFREAPPHRPGRATAVLLMTGCEFQAFQDFKLQWCVLNIGCVSVHLLVCWSAGVCLHGPVHRSRNLRSPGSPS